MWLSCNFTVLFQCVLYLLFASDFYVRLVTFRNKQLTYLILIFRCKKFDVPIEKIYNKTQRDKFRWAIDMAGPEYVF